MSVTMYLKQSVHRKLSKNWSFNAHTHLTIPAARELCSYLEVVMQSNGKSKSLGVACILESLHTLVKYFEISG